MKKKFNPFITSMAIIIVSTGIFLTSAFPLESIFKSLSERGIESLLKSFNLILGGVVVISLVAYLIYRAAAKDDNIKKDR